MKAFDNSEFEKHREEAKEKWGETEAFREHEEKTRGYTKDTWNRLTGEMEAIFEGFAVCRNQGTAPDSAEAQSLVKTLQHHITAQYYHCTKEILAGLGQMYVLDERFRQNIDTHGDGTASFVCKAIEIYCGK